MDAFAQGRWPVVLKAVSGGYDGRGVWVCESPAQAAAVLGHGGPGPGLPGRGVRRVRPRAGRAGGPLAAPAGRRLPGGRDRPAGRDLPRGDRSRAGPGARPGGRGARARAAPGRRARRDRAAGRRAVRDAGRPAGQRAGHAPAQHRALDDRGRADLAVRAAPAGRPGPAARFPVAGRAGHGDGQRARRRRRGHLRPVHPCDGGGPGREGAHVRQAGASGPQDRPRHRARLRLPPPTRPSWPTAPAGPPVSCAGARRTASDRPRLP